MNQGCIQLQQFSVYSLYGVPLSVLGKRMAEIMYAYKSMMMIIIDF